MIIYKITNLLDGKIYVGRTTKTLNKRMMGHLRNKRHSLIDEAIRTLGIENFKVEIIARCKTFEELKSLERYFIRELNCTLPNGYNVIGYKNAPKEQIIVPGQKRAVTEKKYDEIFTDLKSKIETKEYAFNSFLPSENELTKIYQSSRATIRRALSELIRRGYIQTHQGSRVRVIYEPVERNIFKIGGIESFKEVAIRNGFSYDTKVVLLEKIFADEKIAARSGFKVGDELYDVRRVRYIRGKALILDKNYFLVSVARDFIVSGRVFNSDGIQFEYTESRHRPDYFCFEDTALRHKFNE